MIGFDSTDPPIVRIQLFRTFMWRVHLPDVGRQPDRVYFWTHLDTNEETAVVIDD